MEKWVREYACIVNTIIDRVETVAETEEQVIDTVSGIFTDNDIPPFTAYTSVDRITNEGYYMRLHRDNYQVDSKKFKDGERDPDKLWYRIEDTVPVITAVWFGSTYGTDFKGGIFRFHDGQKVIPIKDKLLVFDPNDIHEVTRQASGSRRITLFKFF